MKKILFLSLIILCTTNLAIATDDPVKGTFSGTVKDKHTGKALQGASIYFSDLKTGGISNSAGEFTIPNVSEGFHLVEVSHIGYTSLAENILIQADTKRDFLLSESIVENNAVIITGVSKATQLKKMPFQVSVMKKEDLQQSSATNIIEAITRKAGVSALSTGPSISKPVIRGLGYNRVLTINDGVRQEGQQWGDEHGIEIDEASVNKIEILKGPASLVYGSDAMAGVLNIVTNVPVPANSLMLNAGANYQSNNRLRSLYGNIAGNMNGFNWNIYGTRKAAADYKNKYDGYVYNSKFNESNLGGYAGYNGSWGFSHLLVSSYQLQAGLVEGERDADGYFIKPLPGGTETRATAADFKSTDPGIPYQDIQHLKIASDNSFKIGKNRLTLTVGWQHNQRKEYGNPDDPDEKALHFDLKTVTYTTQFHFREKNGWKPSVGINGMKQDNTNKGLEQLIPDYSLTDIGAYGIVQKDIRNLSITGGARFDTRNIDVKDLLDAGSIKGPGFSRKFSNFSGSIGVAYQATKNINLKLNIARAFRAPGIAELASNGAHEGTTRYEYGEKRLSSEISTQVDASFDFNNDHFSFNLAGYFNNFSNFIFYRKLESINGGDSTIDVNGDMLTAFRFDQRGAYLYGLEASLDIHPHPLDWLHLQNTFSYVSGKLKEKLDGSGNLPFIPAPRLLTELRGDFKSLNRFVKNTYVKFEVENTFKQSNPFTGYNTESATAAYTLLNAGAGADWINKKGQVIMSLHIVATNLADVAYQHHLSRLKYAPENMATGRNGVFNMGRNFSVKLNIPISVELRKK